MCYYKDVRSLFSVFTFGNLGKFIRINPIKNIVKGFDIHLTPFIDQFIPLLGFNSSVGLLILSTKIRGDHLYSTIFQTL